MSEINPHEHVPDRIDTITAEGIAELHEALSDANAARLANEPPEVQAALLWRMVESGAVDLSLGPQ
jgi:hypothetical protein